VPEFIYDFDAFREWLKGYRSEYVGGWDEHEIPPPIRISEREKTVEEVEENMPVHCGALPERSPFKFFVDGTYRILRAGHIGPIPMYAASVSAACVRRPHLGASLEVLPFLSTLSLVALLLPFKAAAELLENAGVPKAKQLKDGSKILAQMLVSLGFEAVTGAQFIGREETKGVCLSPLEHLQRVSRPPLLVVSDMSALGLDERGLDLKAEDIFDEARLRSKAAIRARVLMTALECCLIKQAARRCRDGELVMLDGSPANHHKYFYSATNQDKEYEQIKPFIVGLVKQIRVRPEGYDDVLLTLGDRQIVVSHSREPDLSEEEMIETGEANLIGQTHWLCVYLRFRRPYYHSENTPSRVGLIKVVAAPLLLKKNFDSPTAVNHARHLAAAVLLERWPLPVDRKRRWNEPAAIETAEKVARSCVLTDMYLRSLVRDIIRRLR